jgi:transposase
VVIIGVDAHKDTHTLVAVDRVGRHLAETVIESSAAGHGAGLDWATTRFGPEVMWAVEDVRHVSSGLERDLLSAGQRVVRVPTKLMARTRASARTRGKSDPIDALAIGRAVLREPDLPVAVTPGPYRELKLLVDRRDDLVVQRTATMTRLMWRIHELDPARAKKPSQWLTQVHRAALDEWLSGQTSLMAELAADEVGDLAHFSASIDALQKRIGAQVKAQHPQLLALPGCGLLSAAKISAETGDVTRFRNEAAFARHAGVAPTPAWSGQDAGRLRAGRTGNRQLNRALHKIAVTQVRLGGPGHAYYRRRMDRGDNGPTAMRCLKRKIARVVYRRLLDDAKLTSAPKTAADATDAE